ncbi:DUF4402 domain-containing protein [Colwellia ponticola]|uniref:DUF4402 domain-containing protein n=1 Tax=Colwellia ponticola TaxID=2304625 RepID=A0A8H2JJV0_9GAMM|nr:DUF4402 domain-containing protein [Colwellia ponticola]RGP39473.1 hypothetical protein BPTFM16_02884 [Altererythrobacter insulae]TMM43113.1 DUF4402 domain-containing protein [Colwellia ponticola]
MKRKLVILLYFFACFLTFSLHAEKVTLIKPLSFGTIVLKDNSASHQYTITFAGNVHVDPAFILITPGHPAEFLISEFTPHTLLNLNVFTVDNNTQIAGESHPTSSQFTINNHHTAASTVTTNALGEASVFVGATLTSSGTGFYVDTTYYNQLILMVDY